MNLPHTLARTHAQTTRMHAHANTHAHALTHSLSLTRQELKDHMRGVNRDLNVVHVDILTEPNGRSKGCALVE